MFVEFLPNKIENLASWTSEVVSKMIKSGEMERQAKVIVKNGSKRLSCNFQCVIWSGFPKSI